MHELRVRDNNKKTEIEKLRGLTSSACLSNHERKFYSTLMKI